MSATPKEKVLEEWDISRLIPYEKNVKIHTKEQLKKIAASIKEHGLVNPPNVEPDGTIITGHGRHLALMNELGWKKVPVWVRHDLTKIEAAALRLADNKVAEGQIDTTMLQEELSWLNEEMESLESLGFDERELAFLTEDIGTLDIDLLSESSMFEPSAEIAETTSEDLMAKADEAMQPIAKVLGFKNIPTSDARVLGKFIALLKDKYNTEDACSALMSFVKEVGDA